MHRETHSSCDFFYVLLFASLPAFGEKTPQANIHSPFWDVDHGRRWGFSSKIEDFSGGRGTTAGLISLCNDQQKRLEKAEIFCPCLVEGIHVGTAYLCKARCQSLCVDLCVLEISPFPAEFG